MDNGQDALDQLYDAVKRLKKHGCDLDYIVKQVEEAYHDHDEA